MSVPPINEGHENGGKFYEAARKGDLEEVKDLVEKGSIACAEWDVNPIKGVIEGSERWRIAEVLLRKQGPDQLLLQARCPKFGDTLLHLAAKRKKEKLAIRLMKALALCNDNDRQCFLEAVNNDGQTALHIAIQNLLTPVVAEFTSETKLKINMKNKSNHTAFDVIKIECHNCTLKDDWKTPWEISIMLRRAGAKNANKLEKYEDEEDTVKKLTAIESLIMDNKAWNKTTNIILIAATLAVTLVFAAIFTIPQMLTPGGGGKDQSYDSRLQDILSHNKPFGMFISFLTLACVLMFCVIGNILLTITSNNEIRAYILCFSWGSICIMGASLASAYIIAVYMYLGYLFTYILMACVSTIIAFNIFLAFYFDPHKVFWETISTLLSMTLLHGFFVTLLFSILPKRIVEKLLNLFDV